jgi:hypothetical protein
LKPGPAHRVALQMHSLMKMFRRTHWTIHCLGIAGLFVMLIALRSLLFFPSLERLHLALFDLIAGIGGLFLEIVSLVYESRHKAPRRIND